MYTRLARAQRAVPVALGTVTLVGVALLFVSDIRPALFPAGAHTFLGAFPLAAIALAYLIYQAAHRPSPAECAKAIALVAAFLFWAANQFWPDLSQATVFNDIAIGLFVLDIFLVLIGWPATSGDESFGENSCRMDCCAVCGTKHPRDGNIPTATPCRKL